MTRSIDSTEDVKCREFQVNVDSGRRRTQIRATVEPAETKRRLDRSIAPVVDLDLLDFLVKIGESSEYMEPLSKDEWELASRGIDKGVLEVVDENGVRVLRRLVEPPVSVMHVTVWHDEWRKGLQAASRFAPYASRDLVLTTLPRNTTELELEAAFFGIGLCTGSWSEEDPAERICDFEPFILKRFTGAAWLFSEKVFAKASAAGVVDDAISTRSSSPDPWAPLS